MRGSDIAGLLVSAGYTLIQMHDMEPMAVCRKPKDPRSDSRKDESHPCAAGRDRSQPQRRDINANNSGTTAQDGATVRQNRVVSGTMEGQTVAKVSGDIIAGTAQVRGASMRSCRVPPAINLRVVLLNSRLVRGVKPSCEGLEERDAVLK